MTYYKKTSYDFISSLINSRRTKSNESNGSCYGGSAFFLSSVLGAQCKLDRTGCLGVLSIVVPRMRRTSLE